MLIENDKKEIKYLKTLGFKRVWFDDKSGFWFTLKIKSKFLKSLQINIEDFQGSAIILVDCKELENDNTLGYVTISSRKYSRKKLNKILKYFN